MSFAPKIIICARCNKPVERIEQTEFWRDTPRHTVRVRVFCHGAQEYEDVLLDRLWGVQIEFGRAFEPPAALPVMGEQRRRLPGHG